MNIGYARVSTDGQNLDLQINALHDAGCTRIFCDVASGAKTDRQELDKCLKLLQPGDVFIVWKLDRLGRSLHQLVNVVHDFNQRSIGFKVVTSPIDTTTAAGKLIFGIFASLAEFERALIQERVVAGMAAARRRGIILGRPRIDPRKLRKAFRDIASANGTVRQIAKRHGIGKSKLYMSLRMP